MERSSAATLPAATAAAQVGSLFVARSMASPRVRTGAALLFAAAGSETSPVWRLAAGAVACWAIALKLPITELQSRMLKAMLAARRGLQERDEWLRAETCDADLRALLECNLVMGRHEN